jgi:hypothetical protein
MSNKQLRRSSRLFPAALAFIASALLLLSTAATPSSAKNDEGAGALHAVPAAAVASGYGGKYSGMVQTLLSRAGGWQCPANASDSGTPPSIHATSSCPRDQSVDTAVTLSWAAECYARQGETNKAERMAEQAYEALSQAERLCSSAPTIAGGKSCETERIYHCGEIKSMGGGGGGGYNSSASSGGGYGGGGGGGASSGTSSGGGNSSSSSEDPNAAIAKLNGELESLSRAKERERQVLEQERKEQEEAANMRPRDLTPKGPGDLGSLSRGAATAGGLGADAAAERGRRYGEAAGTGGATSDADVAGLLRDSQADVSNDASFAPEPFARPFNASSELRAIAAKEGEFFAAENPNTYELYTPGRKGQAEGWGDESGVAQDLYRNAPPQRVVEFLPNGQVRVAEYKQPGVVSDSIRTSAASPDSTDGTEMSVDNIYFPPDGQPCAGGCGGATPSPAPTNFTDPSEPERKQAQDKSGARTIPQRAYDAVSEKAGAMIKSFNDWWENSIASPANVPMTRPPIDWAKQKWDETKDGIERIKNLKKNGLLSDPDPNKNQGQDPNSKPL